MGSTSLLGLVLTCLILTVSTGPIQQDSENLHGSQSSSCDTRLDKWRLYLTDGETDRIAQALQLEASCLNRPTDSLLCNRASRVFTRLADALWHSGRHPYPEDRLKIAIELYKISLRLNGSNAYAKYSLDLVEELARSFEDDDTNEFRGGPRGIDYVPLVDEP